MKRIVVALGGNALGNTPLEQALLAKSTAKAIVDLIAGNNQVIITHGNGPQVGMINQAFELASEIELTLPLMPFPECGALSQGYIGYHLQNAIGDEFSRRDMPNKVATVITQVVVDKADPAFLSPSKPIGSFYTAEKARKLESERGYTMREDAGRGYRRVVPSPKPIGVVELDIIRSLMEAGHTVIACGGGGIPVTRSGGKLIGIPAVIDKDFASAKLAELINADYLFILTAVDKVALYYGKDYQKDLDILTASQAKNYIQQGHFAKGSMLPKVEAAVAFVEGGYQKTAIIASLDNAALALQGLAGTKIIAG